MGKKIGKYELGKTLGSGNFSKVKLATDIETGEQWAIKIIEKEQLQRDHMEEQLKREIALMKQLKHPHIIQLREVMQTANHIYLVLELITGGELFDKIIQHQRLPEPLARRYFQELVLAVLYCHKHGIAHRDLKPENLLLDAKDHIKISDFGLSNLQPTNAHELLQTVCGTPNYVAPEVLRERGYNGFHADAWSCGIVLYVMLAGYLPFDDPNMNALFNKIERGEYRMARFFTPQAADLISKLLVVDVTKRLTLEQVTQHPWFLVDFDVGLLDSTRPVALDTSDSQIASAITATVETEAAAAGGAAPAAGGLAAAVAAAPTAEAARAGTVLTGFDIVGRLTATNLNPFATSEMQQRTAIRFFFRGTIPDFLPVLTEMKMNPKAPAPVPGIPVQELKGFYNTGKGMATYVLEMTPTVIADDVFFVEVRRNRGDLQEFYGLVQRVMSMLGPKVLSRVRTDLMPTLAAPAGA